MRSVWVRGVADERRRGVVDSGLVFSRSKKLHTIQCLSIPSTDASSVMSFNDVGSICDRACSRFREKWGCHNSSAIENALDFCSRSEGTRLVFSREEMERAFICLDKRHLLDLDGLCMNLLFAFWSASEAFFMQWIIDLLSSSKSMGESRAKGNFWEEECSMFH